MLPDLESGLHPLALVCGAVSTFLATFLIPRAQQGETLALGIEELEGLCHFV